MILDGLEEETFPEVLLCELLCIKCCLLKEQSPILQGFKSLVVQICGMEPMYTSGTVRKDGGQFSVETYLESHYSFRSNFKTWSFVL